MNYPQLIQFKRPDEKGILFLNARQFMLGAFGFLGGMLVATNLGITDKAIYWGIWGLRGVVGVIAGGVYHGVYGYQYVKMLLKTWTSLEKVVDPAALYERSFDEAMSYSVGAPDGSGALMQYHPPARRSRNGQAWVGGASIYRLSPVDLAQYPPQTVSALINRWSGFWSGLRAPVRLVIHSTPFRAESVINEVHSQVLMARDEWRARALSGYERFLEELTRQAAMYEIHHDCLVWANSDTEAGATIGSLTGYLGVSAQAGEMKPLLEGRYRILADHLQPENPRHPFIILLVSHEFSGEWSWVDPLVAILRQSFPVSIALDVEQTMSPNRARGKLVQYENVVLDEINNNKTGRNPKMEGALQDIQVALAKANAGMALHFTTVVIAVKGDTLDEARQHAAAIKTLTAAQISLITLPGGQAELLKFFTPANRKRINLPEISHNVTSDGMAVMSGPLGFRRRSNTKGILWGVGSTGGQDTYPIYWNGFGDDPDKPSAYHGLFLGKSGFGKTVTMQALLYREAMQGVQVILMEPQGHSRRLVELVGKGGSYNPLSLRTMRINPLDLISNNMTEQKAHLSIIIRLMLKQVDPHRYLTMQEAGLLDAALSIVYDGLEDPLNTPAIHVPRLEHLVHHLFRLGAERLASDLELNFVSGSMGEVYNQATNLDVGLDADVVAYDFKEIPESSRTLIYTLVLGRIQRIVRLSGRVRRRIVAIDEFGWMAKEPMLAETVAGWYKTFRTFGCGVWLAEQDLLRLTGAGERDLSGHSIVSNTRFQLFFHHESAAADVVAKTFPNVAPYRGALESFPSPQETGRAEAILRLPDGAYHTFMILTHGETPLIGS